MRYVATPIGRPAVPAPRTDTFDPGLLDACVRLPEIEAQLERLREPGTLVVTTGQQPGLFTGPLYTIHKALSAAALARVLARHWDRPVVPVFWMAGDDHDFAEASRATWQTGDGGLRDVALPARAPDAPLTPMSQELLGAEVDACLALLADDLPASEFRDETLEWLRRHYRPDATVAAAYGGALAELLAPSGVVVLDSTHSTVKARAAEHLLAALEGDEALERALARRAAELERAGADPGVALGDGATLVMVEAAAGRDRLVRDGDGYLTRRSRERFDRQTLRALAREEPGRLSPNVLLRPVVESALLPTVAYVAGPGELRYLALTGPVYDALGVPRQTPLPRWSGLLVEPRVDRVLAKFGIGLADLLEPEGALESRLVRSQLPADAIAALAALRESIAARYDEITRSAIAIDPTMERPVRSAKHQALASSHDIEKRLVQHLKRRQETELGQLARARSSVLPHGKPQERVLTVAPFLARYGPALLTELADAIHEWYAGALEGARVTA